MGSPLPRMSAERARQIGRWSLRAALGLLASARAWALLESRDSVLPEDIQAVLPGIAGHRLRPVHDGARRSSIDTAAGLIAAVAIP